MAKQTNATVYYCDKCRKSVIGSPRVDKEAEAIGIAHGINPAVHSEIDKLPFTPSVMNSFVVPMLDIQVGTTNPDETVNVQLQVESKIKYLCDECAEDILDDYTTWCQTIGELFV